MLPWVHCLCHGHRMFHGLLGSIRRGERGERGGLGPKSMSHKRPNKIFSIVNFFFPSSVTLVWRGGGPPLRVPRHQQDPQHTRVGGGGGLSADWREGSGVECGAQAASLHAPSLGSFGQSTLDLC